MNFDEIRCNLYICKKCKLHKKTQEYMYMLNMHGQITNSINFNKFNI